MNFFTNTLFYNDDDLNKIKGSIPEIQLEQIYLTKVNNLFPTDEKMSISDYYSEFFQKKEVNEESWETFYFFIKDVLKTPKWKLIQDSLLKLKIATSVYDYNFDEHDANIAAEFGKINTLKWFRSKFKVNPTVCGCNWACERNNLNTIKWIYKKNKILPNSDGLDWSCFYGYQRIIEYVLEVSGRRIRPTLLGANAACRNAHLNIVQYLFHNLKLLPDIKGLLYASRKGFIGIIGFLLLRGLKPTVRCANHAAKYGHVHVLKVFASMSILPDIKGIAYAVDRKNVNVLEWFKSIK